MYCVKCGVKLADTEKKCPLCETVVYHPDIAQPDTKPLYPKDKLPDRKTGSKVLHGVIAILFLLPITVCIIADLMHNGSLNWSGYVTGALVFAYVSLVLPRWFDRPNPIIFTPCAFITLGAYLWYINFAIGGSWFLSFALPVVGGLGIITCAVVTLLYCLSKGVLYILGGASVGLGAFMLLIEYLAACAFDINFIGWSYYPLTVLSLIGILLIYLAINNVAREIMGRKLFF